MMEPGDSLSFLHRHGGELQISRPTDGTFSVRRMDARGYVTMETSALGRDTAWGATSRYLGNDVTASITQVRTVEK